MSTERKKCARKAQQQLHSELTHLLKLAELCQAVRQHLCYTGSVLDSAVELLRLGQLGKSTTAVQGRRRAHIPLQNRKERAVVLPSLPRGCCEVLKCAQELATAGLLPALAHAQQAPGQAEQAARVALRTADHRLPGTPPSRPCSTCLELAATPLQATVLGPMGALPDTLPARRIQHRPVCLVKLLLSALCERAQQPRALAMHATSGLFTGLQRRRS